MTNRQSLRLTPFSYLAWAIWVLTILLIAFGVSFVALNYATPDVPQTVGSQEFYPVLPLAFSTVGAIIASRVSRNIIGWLFLAVGLLSAVDLVWYGYAVYGILTEPDSVPVSELAAWLHNWNWVVSVSGCAVFLPLLFPDGRIPGPRWRFLAWAGAVATVAAAVSIAFYPGPMEEFNILDNPMLRQMILNCSSAI